MDSDDTVSYPSSTCSDDDDLPTHRAALSTRAVLRGLIDLDIQAHGCGVTSLSAVVQASTLPDLQQPRCCPHWPHCFCPQRSATVADTHARGSITGLRHSADAPQLETGVKHHKMHQSDGQAIGCEGTVHAQKGLTWHLRGLQQLEVLDLEGV
jgi:hypothetical protein